MSFSIELLMTISNWAPLLRGRWSFHLFGGGLGRATCSHRISLGKLMINQHFGASLQTYRCVMYNHVCICVYIIYILYDLYKIIITNNYIYPINRRVVYQGPWLCTTYDSWDAPWSRRWVCNSLGRSVFRFSNRTYRRCFLPLNVSWHVISFHHIFPDDTFEYFWRPMWSGTDTCIWLNYIDLTATSLES